VCAGFLDPVLASIQEPQDEAHEVTVGVSRITSDSERLFSALSARIMLFLAEIMLLLGKSEGSEYSEAFR
jgi:hypothetical protein